MGSGRSRLHAHLHCAVPGDLSKNASLTAGLPDAREVMASTPGNSAIAHAHSESRPPRASRAPPGRSSQQKGAVMWASKVARCAGSSSLLTCAKKPPSPRGPWKRDCSPRKPAWGSGDSARVERNNSEGARCELDEWLARTLTVKVKPALELVRAVGHDRPSYSCSSSHVV